MRKPSLAEAVLTAVELLTDDLVWLFEAPASQSTAVFQGAIRRLAALEEVAKSRVDDATYQAHRRSMEKCHVAIPEQVSRG